MTSERRWAVAAWVLIGLGVLLRVARWADNRSLWLDEVFLASDREHGSFAGLLLRLDYREGAGVGFLVLCKALITALGSSEMALRLVPLVAGVAALPLGYFLARRLIEEWGAVVALALMV